MTQISIIGAGLSGRLLALHLCRQASSALGIRMIDRGDARYMGPAYSPEADYMLLNVPAGRMGAFPDDQEHFLKWAQERGTRADQLDFLPRRLYRDYVLDLLEEARRERTDGPRFEQLRGEVTDIEVGPGTATIHIDGAEPLVAERVVLALGNFPPRHPSVQNRAALEDPRYVRNPWAPGVLDSLSRSDTVVLIGTGQTMVDLAVALDRRAHQGRIVALSRRGILPLAHRGFEPYPSFFGEIEGSRRIRDIFRTVRRHLERAESMGMDGRAVIDSLRPDTQALWQGLPEDEKRRFLRHGFRYWEIIRSRIPQESEAAIHRMRTSGQMEIVAGRIRDLVGTEKALEMHYTPRDATRDVVVRASLVINCIGPEPDYNRVDEALVKNLLRRGLIRPGPANLGMDALPNGAVIGRDGAASAVLYTLGSPMKGVLWEVLAVPDIRVQAQQLARLLLESLGGPIGDRGDPGMTDPLAILRAVASRNLDRPAKARALAEALQATRGYRWVGLYDVTDIEIRAIAWTGATAPAFPTFPRSQGLNGAAVASGQPVVVQDVSKDPRWLTTFGSTRAEAIFPVRVAGAVVGTIDVESDRVGAFTESDQEFLAAAAEILRPLWAA